jgi:hypothetical protein
MKDIGAELSLSVRTVESHTYEIDGDARRALDDRAREIRTGAPADHRVAPFASVVSNPTWYYFC